jgi:uncharacterized protein YaiE (UPF0345 family)
MWALTGSSASGGRSVSGSEQVIATSAGFWRAKFEIDVKDETKILAWRAFVAQLDGRAGVADVPVFDKFTPFDAHGRRLPFVASARLDSSGMFDNGQLAQQRSTAAALTVSALAGATEILVTALQSWQVPRPGAYFGVNDRLYRVKSAHRAADSDPWRLRFQPPLRQSATAGTALVVEYPTCPMRLSEDGGGEAVFRPGFFGELSVEFVEAV